MVGRNAPPGPPAEDPAHHGTLRWSNRESVGRSRTCFCLQAPQETRSYLCGAGAEQQRCRDTPPVGNAIRGDDRNAHRADDGGQQGKEPDHFALCTGGIEATAMATRLHSLCDQDIRARGLRRTRFSDGRDVGEPGYLLRLGRDTNSGG